MTRFALALLLALAAGCSSHKLADSYRPLERIREGNPLGSSVATTLGTTVWVADLEDWLEERPEGSPRYEAVLMHERVHAQEQLERGVLAWTARYLSDPDFAWEAEKRGWAVQLRVLQRRGQQINAGGVAKALDNYKVPGGDLCDWQEALQFVRDVLAGRWP